MSLWVEESDRSLYWNGDLVVSTSVSSDKLVCSFGPTWQEFLQQDSKEAEDLHAKASLSLQRALLMKSKGKGKGKMNAAPIRKTVFGNVDIEDY